MTKTISFYICSLLFCVSCTGITNKIEEKHLIVAGTTTLTGVISVPEKLKQDNIIVTITSIRPISGENVIQEVVADRSGKFSATFDVELNNSLTGLYTSIDPYKVLYFETIANDSTHINITYDSNNNIKNTNVIPAANNYDMMQSDVALNRMIDYKPDDPDWEYLHLYRKSPDEFLDIVRKNVAMRLAQFVDNDNLFSKETKDRIAKDYRFYIYTGDVFDYKKTMRKNYLVSTKDSMGLPVFEDIDRNYFRFLKDLELNDPQYLHTFTFPELQDSILQNDILAIPDIGEKDIPTWLMEVKAILSNLVGFDSGPYYDILASNAYARQLRNEARPLSEKQKENINLYWKDGEIAKILFRTNEKVINYNAVRSPLLVHDISTVAKEQVMNEIITKYKNKVVFIDFWATWCEPCLRAMKQFNNIKGEFTAEDVVFVYITNSSSPKKLWTSKIKAIGHDHYYLHAEQWDHNGTFRIEVYTLIFDL